MKPGAIAIRLLAAAVCVAAALYIGVNMAAYFMDPYTITVAYRYTSENAVTVSGYVVRDEEVLSGGGELVYSPRSEGEKVSAGGTVALAYQSAQALEDANSLRSLEDQLDQLLYAQSLASGAQTAAGLDSEIRQSLKRFRSSVAAGDLNAAGDSGDTLRSAVLKWSYAYSGTGDLDAAIADLEGQINTLSASASAGTNRIAAPRTGLFSSLVDGYEAVLRPEGLQDMTPTAFRAIAPAAGVTGVGRMIYGDRWYYAALMDAGDAKGMQEGDEITLRFQSGLDRDMKMTVDHISAEESGQRVAVFRSADYLSLTTLLRHQNAQVIFGSYAGIRVPRSAVRLDPRPVTDEEGEPVLDASGAEKTENVTCVYCLWGTSARLKPVKVLWQEDEYMVVVPDEDYLNTITSASSREGRRLRAGDEVITAAEDIFDGKVIR